MAKTDWQMGDTVLPDDLNQIGQEINQNRDSLAAHTAATADVHGATSAATPNTIVQRDPQGRIKAAAPAEADDVARKAETDAAFAAANEAQATANAALPKTGGTITGDLTVQGSLRTKNGLGSILIGDDAVIEDFNRANSIRVKGIQNPNAGDIFVSENNWKVWHQGNDGQGSGLDADFVRGYVPINKSGDHMEGPLTSHEFGFRTPSLDRPLITKGFDPFTSGLYAGMGRWGIFMEPGRIGFGVPGGDPRVFQYREDSTIAAEYRLWHEGNDGPGSGLDADLLDGLHASNFWTKSEIPYETGGWTPELRFGGSTAGITYASRWGRYTRIANVVYWSFEISLSSRGSASGAAWITGLPFNKEAGLEFDHSVGRASNIALPGGQWLVSYISFATIYLNTNTGSYITDAAFANNSSLRASGFYFI